MSAVGSVEGRRKNLRATLSSEDFEKVERICERSADSTFKKCLERQVVELDNLLKQIIGIYEQPSDVNLRPSRWSTCPTTNFRQQKKL